MNDTITYGTWLRNWINIYKKPYIKTWKRVQANIRLHVPDYIKRLRLKDLNVLDLQKALNGVATSRMRLEVYDIYRGSLTTAYKLGIIKTDITQLLIKPRHIRIVGTPLTSSELAYFLYSFHDHKLLPFFSFLVLTGARRSEALNVKWDDIDFENKTIHLKGTKTDKSNRYVPLFNELVFYLSSIPKKKNTKVFSFSSSYVSHVFSDFCSKHGYNHKLHDLRHTFATICLERGISIKVIQEWLGHTRLDTTSSIYSHVRTDFVKAEASKFSLF